MNVRFATATVLGALLATPLPAQRELEALVEQLASADAAARSRAYTTLQRDRPPQLVPLLGKRLEAMPPDGQRLALILLQQQPIDATRPVYTRLLGADRPLLRATGAAMLVRHGDRTRLPVLTKSVAEAPLDERLPVLQALHGIDDAAVLDAVRSYLAPGVSGALAVAALQHLRQQEKARSATTTAAARSLVTSSDVDVRAAALVWLAGGEGAEPFAKELAALLTDAWPRFWLVERLFERDHRYPAVLHEVFGKALAAPRSPYDVDTLTVLLKAQAPERLAPVLRQLLAHEQDRIRTAAMQALAALPGGLQPKELLQLLQTGNAEQQLAAAQVLRRMDDPAGLSAVLTLARTAGPHQAEAVRVLAGFRCRDAVEPLLAALDAPAVPVRQAAWNGLQPLLRDLFPYRRFAFETAGYDPNATDRTTGLQTLRAWWAAVR